MNSSEALRAMRERGYAVRLERGRVVVDGPADGLLPERAATALEWLRTHHAMLRDLLGIEVRCLAHPAVAAAAEVLGARGLTTYPPGAKSRYPRGTLVISFADQGTTQGTAVSSGLAEMADARDQHTRERDARLTAGTTAEGTLAELTEAGYEIVQAGDDVMVYAPLDDPHLEPVDPEHPQRKRRYLSGPYAQPDRIAALVRTHRARLVELCT